MDKKELLIICAGNEIMGDDGVGIEVGKFLERKGYKVINVGTDIFKLLNYYKDESKIIVIDAIVSENLPPGRVIHLKGDKIFQRLEGGFRSAHYMGIIDGLKLLTFMYCKLRDVEMHFVGITIKKVKLGQGLSKAVRNAIPKAVDIIDKDITTRDHISQ